jgi:hypothetical protein
VTNEHYLYVSYFVAVGAGITVAAVMTLWLGRAHREATAGAAANGLGTVLRRAFPAWLILAVLLGFMSVTYFDCSHGSYATIVADREHLIHKTQEQVTAMCRYLAVALVAYGFVIMLFLWARARADRKNSAHGTSAEASAEFPSGCSRRFRKAWPQRN